MSKNVHEDFERIHKELLDAYESGFIDGDTLDLIRNAIVYAYPNESRRISIENGSMQDGDEDFFDVDIAELFDAVQDKNGMVREFEIAINYGSKVSGVSELVEIIQGFRENKSG